MKQQTPHHRQARFAWIAAATVLALLLNLGQGILPGTTAPVAQAHNLQTRMIYMFFDPTTQACLDARLEGTPLPPGCAPLPPGWAPGDPVLQAGDELGVIIKVVPRDGTTTGVGGHIDFYVPDGVQVVDVAYVIPDGSGDFAKVAMKGQSPIAIGAGAIGAKTTAQLVGLADVYTSTASGLSATAVNPATGLHRGTIAGLYGDTGIFFATDPDTAYGSWQNSVYGAGSTANGCGSLAFNPAALGKTLVNNSGDTVVPCNKWDAGQLLAWGVKGGTFGQSAPIVDYADGRGNAPWGFANGVAGPQSGYTWEFDWNEWQASAKGAAAMRAAMSNDSIGPWQRIRYPGSRISYDQPGLLSTEIGYANIDGSSVGFSLSPGTPLTATVSQTDAASPKAIRWAVGQLTAYRPEYAWVKIRVQNAAAGITDPSGCPDLHGDTFGGDAGGTDNGKDHLWRYYEPTEVKLNMCVAAGKPATAELVKPGVIFQYPIRAYNLQDFPLTNVVVKDTLGSGLTFLGAAPAQNSGPNPLIWNVGTLLPGQKFEALVNVTAKSTGFLDNCMEVASDQLGVQTVCDSTTSGGYPYLAPSKTAASATVTPGGAVTYTLLVKNIGTAASASPVILNEYLPAGFTFGSLVATTVNGAAASGVTVNASNPNQPTFAVPVAIQAGKELRLTFTAAVPANAASGTYCNMYRVVDNGIPITTGSEACVTVGGASVGDTVYRDWNGNGVQDTGEEGIPGIQVCANPGNQCATTDANGRYLINSLAAGGYTVDVTNPPAGYTATQGAHPTAVTLNDGDNVTTVDFGYLPGGAGRIGDQVFEDIGKDGAFNGSDAGIANVTLWLYEDTDGDGVIGVGDNKIMATTTDANGVYTFTGLATGLSYIVDLDGGDPDISTYFTNKYGATSYQLTTADPHPAPNLAGSYLNADFGFWRAQPGSIGDTVFADVNGDGIYSPTVDSPLASVAVTLLQDLNGDGAADAGEPILTTSTTVTGFYTFGNLGPGAYVVTVDAADPDLPGGYAATVSHYDVTLAAGEDYLTADFPFVQLIAKIVSPAGAATVPATLTYTITVNYPTEQLLSGVMVTDAIPISTTYVNNSINASGYYTATPEDGGPAQVVWDLGSNEPGLAGLTASAGYALCPVVYTTVITKDAWIRQNDPAKNYGGNTLLITKSKVGDVKYALLGPDVSGIPGGALIRSAKLYLNVQSTRSNHFDKVYMLKTAWTEGTGNNDVCGDSSNGATWNQPNCGASTWAGGGAFSASDYYTNTLLGTFAPSKTGYKSIDVSPAVDAWINGGVANRGLALVSTGKDGGDAKYYNEENTTANTDPYLRVVYLVQTLGGCGGTTTLESSADTFVNQEQATTNNGAVTTMSTQPETNKNRHALVQWDLATIAPGAVISSTVMTLTVTTERFDAPQDHIDQVRRMNTTWTETGAAWNTRDGATPWADGGSFSSADYAATAYFTITQPSSNNTAVTGTLTNLVNDWINNGVTNNGIVLLSTGADNGEAKYGTKENGTAGYRPKLTVSWWLAPNQGATTVTHLRASPMLLGSTGQVRVTMEITASATITNVTPPANLTIGSAGGAAAAAIGGAKISGPSPATPITITAGSVGAFVWVYEVTPNTNPDGIVFTGRPAAPGTLTSFAPATSNSVLIVPALTFQVRADAMPPSGFVSNTARLVEGNVPTEVQSPPAVTAFGASIGDHVWADLDGQGDQDSTEPGIPGVQVCATPASGGATTCAATDASGNYRLYGLTNGANYTVTINLATAPAGYQPTTAASLTRIATTVGVNDADFGIRPPGQGTIGDTVWRDADEDGALDAGENGLPGVTVKLYNAAGTLLLATTTTDTSGVYTFTGLYSNTYKVLVDATSVVTSPYGVASTLAAAMDLVSVAGATSPLSNPLTVVVPSDTAAVTTADFGFNWGGSIGDYVWWDANVNRLQDESPATPIANAAVLLYFDANANGVLDAINGDYQVGFDLTDAGGRYLFDNLPPGRYLVDVYEDSITTDGDRDIVPTTLDVQAKDLSPNEDYLAADFGYYEGAKVAGNVFWDEDHNGVLDGHERDAAHLLEDVTVNIVCLGPDGAAGGGDDYSGSMETGAQGLPDGHFAFIVPPGPCTLTYDQGDIPAEYTDRTTPTSYTFTAVGGEDWHPSFDFGVDHGGVIGDTVFLDADGDGSQGIDEPGLAGVTVRLYDSTGTTLRDLAVTDSQGGYLFSGLADGSYIVRPDGATAPAGYSLTTANDPYSATLSAGNGHQDLAADFGYRDGSGGAANVHTLRGVVWHDANGDGIYSSEAVIPTVTVTVDCGADGLFVVTTRASGIGGNWSVTGIPDGSTCLVTVDTTTLPNAAYVQTGDPDQPGAPCTTCDSRTTVVNIVADVSNLNFGYQQQLGSISGTVCEAYDGAGICQATAPPLSPVTVTLRYAGPDGYLGTADDITQTLLTDSSGVYTFTDLLPGAYQISQTNLPGYTSVADRDGFNPDNISVNLGQAQQLTGQDFQDAPSPDIAIDKALTAPLSGLALVGDTITYTIRVTNTGSVTLTALSLVDIYDAARLAFTGGSITPDAQASGALTWTTHLTPALPLAPGQGFTFTTRFQATAASDPATITNTASVTATDLLGRPAGPAADQAAILTRAPAQIGDRVWWDMDGDGAQDAGEPGIPGVIVVLTDSLGIATTTATDSAGVYTFPHLFAGAYTVAPVAGGLPNWYPTQPAPALTTTAVSAGQTRTDADFGFNIASAYTLTKQLNTADPVRPSEAISFTIRITNTGATWITALPLTDVYSATYLTFGFGATFATPSTDDQVNDGVLTWADVLNPSRGGPGPLAPGAGLAITVTFTGRSDTHGLDAAGTRNIATIQDGRFDPDGPAGAMAAAAVPSVGPASDDAYVRVFVPTGLAVISFKAGAGADGVTLAWQTANEAQILGFNVYRAAGNGVLQRVNTEIIPAEFAGSNQGASYAVNAGPAATGQAYVLEVIDLRGQAMRMPPAQVAMERK